jgi:membrane dipeptidase
MSARRILFSSLLLATIACETPRAEPPVDAAPAVTVGDAEPSPPVAPPKDETLEAKATRIHKDAIIVDGHNDITTIILNSGFDLAKPTGKTHTDLARMKSGGITGEFFSLWVDRAYAEKPTALGGGSARRALDLIDVVYQQVERHPQDLLLATSAGDIRRAKREGKVACLMGIEGGHAIENSLYTLRAFHRLGVRYMTLTHSNDNDWADSAGNGTPHTGPHHGLTPFGEDVVREMQRLGMLVDISHVSDDTFFAVMKIAKTSVIASHSSARALTDHPRNLTDDMLRALAANDGVAMVNFWSVLIDPAYLAADRLFSAKHEKDVKALHEKYKSDHDAFLAAYLELKGKEPTFPKTPLSLLIDHIEHIATVAGIDHVGLGSDFDGVDALPKELTGIEALPKITFELLKRGHSEEDVRKILGLNFLRVFDKAEAYAKSTKTTLSGDGNTKSIGIGAADAGK